MSQLSTVIAAAVFQTRGDYAKSVIRGMQRWSGADLKGKAKRYGASYAIQRRKASRSLRNAGGLVVAIEHGLLVSAAPIGTDDFGNSLYETSRGVYSTRNARKILVRVA